LPPQQLKQAGPAMNALVVRDSASHGAALALDALVQIGGQLDVERLNETLNHPQEPTSPARPPLRVFLSHAEAQHHLDRARKVIEARLGVIGNGTVKRVVAKLLQTLHEDRISVQQHLRRWDGRRRSCMEAAAFVNHLELDVCRISTGDISHALAELNSLQASQDNLIRRASDALDFAPLIDSIEGYFRQGTSAHIVRNDLTR
jgi:hypothetical protein